MTNDISARDWLMRSPRADWNRTPYLMAPNNPRLPGLIHATKTDLLRSRIDKGSTEVDEAVRS